MKPACTSTLPARANEAGPPARPESPPFPEGVRCRTTALAARGAAGLSPTVMAQRKQRRVRQALALFKQAAKGGPDHG